jgi:enoyl-CoA hydratase/carnithine racemase
MAREYTEALARLDADEGVRAIVVTGAGRSFCVGADMSVLDATLEHGTYPPEAPSPDCHLYPLRVRKPLIAAVNGSCAGVGLLMAITCDVRYGAADAKYTTAFSRRGLVAEYGMSWLLPRLVGLANALDLLISGRVILGGEAERMGLLNAALPREEVLPRSLEYARDLAASAAPESMALIKSQVYGDLDLRLEEAFWATQRLVEASLDSPALAEGIAAFQEKRAPRFAPLPPPPPS